MNVIVLSRTKARKFSYSNKENECVIISITDPFSKTNRFARTSYIKDVLRVEFDDIDQQSQGGILMNETHANTIASFVDKWKDKVDTIVVHCEAGVSRSAGTAAAILKFINNDDSPVFDNGRFCPNMHCYRMMLNAFYCEINEEEILIKEERNIKLWKELLEE